MKRSILPTNRERIVNVLTKEEIESLAAMDLNKFINWIVETHGKNVSPVMIQYFKTIHEMCVDIASNNKSSTDS